jgi:chemotaxis protein methyltransferase CheR
LNLGKEALIRARLGKRMRSLGISTLPEYCRLLRSAEGEEEIGNAIDSLTTNFTQFFREKDHFEFLVQQALPGLQARRGTPIRLWSAACATGEEPYTIAFYLEKHYPLKDGWDWRLLATDISQRALDKAIQGIYPEDRLAMMPQDLVRQVFQRGYGQSAGLYRVKKQLQDRIRFQQMNLLEACPPEGSFEVIFCRNVMIYFDRPTQERLAQQLARALVRGGILFTGRSESLNGLAHPLRCLSPSIYQKQS